MPIDILLAILLVFAVIKGYKKGLIVAVFSIVAFIIGLAAAIKLSALVSRYLANNTGISAIWLPFISFLLVFVLVALLIRLGSGLLENTIKNLELGWLNRIGGVFFFTLLYVSIYSIFLFYATKLHIVSTTGINSSASYRLISPIGPFVIEKLGVVFPVFKGMFAELEQFFQSINNKIIY